MKIRIRVIVGIMMFLGYYIMYIVRYNLSVHILDMTQMKKRVYLYNGSEITARATGTRGGVINLINLNSLKISTIFCAYHVGYVICFPIFHTRGDKLGPTLVVGIAGLTSGMLNCLTPAAAYFHFWALFAVRILKGFCAGAMLPSMVQLLRNWMPPTERNHFMWAYCGITIGTFSTFVCCAVIEYYSKWPIGFYVTGVTQIIWAALWICIITDYPAKHPFISKSELDYLNKSLCASFTIKSINSQAPWKQILRSVPFWTLCMLHFGYAWMIISICIHGPMYYCIVVQYSIYSASALTALPFLLRLILGTALMQLFHRFKMNSSPERIRSARRYIVVVSHVLPGLLVASTWVTHLVPGPILLTMAVALTAAGMDLTLELCYELSPTYANLLNTVIKIIGNIPGIVVPLTVGNVTNQFNESPYVWKHVWCFHASVLLLSGMVFLIWGDTHVQPWNSIYQRPPHSPRVKQKPSMMSNIDEVDEDNLSRQQSYRPSMVLKPLKILQPKSSNTV
ncbi:sialin-like [Pectinophora gossypiella]|uniref:sialin-like n=1 Tax=Pectinophora gossypiella TaxID=13191 RepID=UPI00214E20D8|nr:sialin-like [Pectinophora gossypiella]